MNTFPDRSNEIKSFPTCYPLGIFPSWNGQKSCETTGLPLFSTDTDRPLPKAGVSNPQPRKQHFLPQPCFPCNVCLFAHMNTDTRTRLHTHTHFSWVKILTPKQWVLQKLQSNCISWNISGATLQIRLRSKTSTLCTVDPSLFSGASRWQSSEQNCFWSEFLRTFQSRLTSLPLA